MDQEESVQEIVDDSAKRTHKYQQDRRTSKQRLNSKKIQRLSQLNGSLRRMKAVQIKAQICQKSEKSQVAPKQCRICLEGEEEGRLIRPCICSGSITYAHEKCITEWIKRKHDPRLVKTKLVCEMCNTTFKYKSARRRTFDLEQFCKNYQKQKCSFVLFFLFQFFLLLVAIALILLISMSDSGSTMGLKIKKAMIKNDNIRIIFICAVFILFIGLLFLTILFIIEYAIKSEVIITQVMDYTAADHKKKGKIFPRNNIQDIVSEDAS